MASKKILRNIVKVTAISGAVGYLAGRKLKSSILINNVDRKKQLSSLDVAEDKLKLLYSELSEIIVAAAGEEKGLEGRQLKRFKEALSTAKKSKKKLLIVVEGVSERGSKDKDLDLAIKEAERAIKHARTFLLKK